MNDAEPAPFAAERRQFNAGAVAAAVVDDDDFVTQASTERCLDFVHQRPEVAFLVVDGNDDGQLGRQLGDRLGY